MDKELSISATDTAIQQMEKRAEEWRLLCEDIKGLVFTDDTASDAKKALAEANKRMKEYEDLRKELKRLSLTDYNRFEDTYYRLIAKPYKFAEGTAKTNKRHWEEAREQEMHDKLKRYFDELVESLGLTWLEYDRLNISVSAYTGKYNQLVKEVRQAVMNINVDVQIIMDTYGENALEVLAFYMLYLDLKQAIEAYKQHQELVEKAEGYAEAKKKVDAQEKEIAKRFNFALAPEEEKTRTVSVNLKLFPTESQYNEELRGVLLRLNDTVKELKSICDKECIKYE